MTLIFASIFAIGGALRWSQALVAVIAAVGLATILPSRRGFNRRPPLILFLVVAATWTAAQLIPLPASIVHTLTPVLDDLRSDGGQLAGVSVSSTLSMDAAATLRGLIYFVTLSGTAVLALRISVSETGRYALLASVAASAGISALIAGIHELGGATALYGVYHPRQVPPILGPLVNPNHLGCLMAVGAVTSIGLLLYPKQRTTVRVLWVLVMIGCVVVTTATYSRGATVGLAAGIAVALITIVAQQISARDPGQVRRRRENFLVTTLPIGVMVTCALIVAVYLGAGTVMNQLANTHLDEFRAPQTKFAAWRSAKTLIEESPWVGVGRGAFESVFTRVHPASAYATFSHPENEAVQAAVEWGIPATLLLALFGGWVVLLAIRRWRGGPLAAGALGSVMVVGFQSNFDFGMELLGLAVPVTVIVSTLTYAPLHELSGPRLHRARALRIAHIGMMLIGVCLLFTAATRTIEDDHDTLRTDASSELLAESIATHPLDYYGYSILAERLYSANDPSAVTVLNHALRLHPTHPGLHWVAARLLVRAGRLSQAESEYTMAVRYSTDPKVVIAELVDVLPPERAAGAIPIEMPIEAALRVVPLNILAAWLQRVLVQRKDIRAADTLYNLGLRFKRWEMAEVGARYRCKSLPSRRCSLELAKVLMAANKPEEAIQVLAKAPEWDGPRDDQRAAWQLLCEARQATGDAAEAAECKRRLDASGLAGADE